MTLLPENELSDVCPECFGVSSGLKIVPGLGAVPCECRAKVKRAVSFSMIPKEFGIPRLSEIKGDPKRHPQQQKKIDFIRANPDLSYFIYGKNGSGKSFLGWALYVHAVEQGRTAIFAELETLLDEFREFEFQRNEEIKKYPRVSAEMLRSTSRKYTIFLDEICATSPSEYAAKEFFAMLKAATECGHQMIYTVNKTPKEMLDYWSRNDRDIGNSIGRRIADYSEQVNLF